MICGGCHGDMPESVATVLRDEQDSGVPICADCQQRLAAIGVLQPCEPPTEDVDPRPFPDRMRETFNGILRAIGVKAPDSP